MRNTVRRILFYSMLAVAALTFLYPFMWMILTTFKPEREVTDLALIPSRWTVQSYLLAGLTSLIVTGKSDWCSIADNDHNTIWCTVVAAIGDGEFKDVNIFDRRCKVRFRRTGTDQYYIRAAYLLPLIVNSVIGIRIVGISPI